LSSPAVPHFSSVRQPTKPLNAKLPTPEESAQVLTDYMAKAHEDKLRAVAEAETKSKDKIQELQAEVAHLMSLLEEATAAGSQIQQKEPGLYEMPLTNKAASELIGSYQKFIADYVVKASVHRFEAVKSAEAKVVAEYEEKIATLKNGAVSS